MKPINQLAAGILAAVLLAACSAETPWGSNSGAGHLRLSVEPLDNVEAAVPAVRTVSSELVTPPASKFSATLVKEGGGYSKTWSSLDEFAKEESFPVGNYTLSVAYGDDKAQGQVLPTDLGYEHAQYYGETQLTVKDGETTEVRLTASLTNAVVIVEYTEAFKHFFKEYKTIVQPAGGEAINLGSNEALNYVQPGDLNVTIDAVQQNGKELRLNPASFGVEGKHMYKLRYNIYNGEIGNAMMSISFDENLTTDSITVNLSEELQNTRAPQVSTVGFEPGDAIASDPTTPFSGDAKFSVVADGGIQSAKLTVISDDYTASYADENGVIDLCAATADQQSALAADGIKVKGLFRTMELDAGDPEPGPKTMCVIDFADFFQHLEGKCEFSLQVTDELTRASEPVSLTMVSVPIEMNAEALSGMPFGEYTTEILVGYNGPEPTLTSPFTFAVKDAGENVPCEVLSVEAYNGTRSNADYPVKYYKYSIKAPEIETVDEHDAFDVKVLFNGVEDDKMVATVSTVYPEHKMTFDAMTSQLRWRVDFPGLAGKENAETLRAKYMNRLRVFVDGEERGKTYDSDIEAYVINGLTAATTYNVTTSMHANKSEDGKTSVTMETEAPVPNGDFEDLTQTINETLNVGGEFDVKVLFFDDQYQIKCPIVYSEPSEEWSSINKKTFYKGASNANTWFKVVSTYVESSSTGNHAVIRSVAYDHSGVTPPTSGGSGNTNYYCENVPEIKQRSAGELFLGSYDYNDSESRLYGVSFNSRPSSFKFDYKYEVVSEAENERAIVMVEVLDVSGQVIASASKKLESSTSSEMELKLVDTYPFAKPASTLRIRFLSSDAEIPKVHIPSGDELNEGIVNIRGNLTISTNAAHALAVGNVLTVSNLRFEY